MIPSLYPTHSLSLSLPRKRMRIPVALSLSLSASLAALSSLSPTQSIDPLNCSSLDLLIPFPSPSVLLTLEADLQSAPLERGRLMRESSWNLASLASHHVSLLTRSSCEWDDLVLPFSQPPVLCLCIRRFFHRLQRDFMTSGGLRGHADSCNSRDELPAMG